MYAIKIITITPRAYELAFIADIRKKGTVKNVLIQAEKIK